MSLFGGGAKAGSFSHVFAESSASLPSSRRPAREIKTGSKRRHSETSPLQNETKSHFLSEK